MRRCLEPSSRRSRMNEGRAFVGIVREISAGPQQIEVDMLKAQFSSRDLSLRAPSAALALCSGPEPNPKNHYSVTSTSHWSSRGIAATYADFAVDRSRR